MPYPMIHLEVAYQLSGQFDWIEKKGDFLLGSVAPDAVHFHQKYDVHQKEISHIWDCGPIWGVTLESEKWLNNIRTFWKQHRKDANRDFIAGYCTHLLTDWMNDLRMWAPFREKIVAGGDYQEVYDNSRYREEACGFDQWLYRTNVHTKKIWELLSEGRIYELTGCIQADDLARQKQSLLTMQYSGQKEYDIKQYEFFTKAAIDSFIAECVGFIAAQIS